MVIVGGLLQSLFVTALNAQFGKLCKDAHLTSPLIKLVDYQPPNIELLTTELNFSLGYNRTDVTSASKIVHFAGGDIVFHGAKPLQLDDIYVEYEANAAKHREDLLEKVCLNQEGSLIITEKAVPPTTPFTIVIKSHHNPQSNSELFGLYRSEDLLVTQNESAGFRRITYYPDRPDVLSVFTVTITADNKTFPTILSNGNLIRRWVDAKTGMNTVIYHDPHPKPSYLFALVAGKLQSISKEVTVGRPCNEALKRIANDIKPLSWYCGISKPAPRQKKVTIRIWSTSGDTSDMKWALDSAEIAMLWDEVAFGRFYDLDEFNVVSVKDFNAGAMENKGLNIFNHALITANPKITTDQQYDRVRGVIAHEYFHNWSGDRVTLRDWFQLTLKEGFTVFRDQIFTSDITQSPIKRLKDISFMENVQFNQDRSPLAHAIRPRQYATVENFYTATVYEKGAEVIRMYQTILGKELFRKATDRFFALNDHSAATCEDFKHVIEQVSGRDFGQFFYWYRTAGTPQIDVMKVSYSHRTKYFRLTLRQSPVEPLVIPIRLSLFHRENNSTSIDDQLILMTYKEQIFEFENIPSAPVISLLRGFSSPVRINPFQSDKDLIFLAIHDTDYYVRYKALEELLTKAALHDTQAQSMSLSDEVTTVMATIIKLAKSAVYGREMAFFAEVFKLPSLSSMRDRMNPYEPLKAYSAIKAIKKAIVWHHRNELEELYKRLENLEKPEAYNLKPRGIARRSLKNSILSLLNEDDNPKYVEWTIRQLQKRKQANDEAAALAILGAQNPTVEIDTILWNWANEHDTNDLLIDRWLAAVMAWPSPRLIDRYKGLTTSKFYTHNRNPNRLRALTRSFASNSVAFHTSAGYEAVAKEVERWDRFNPKLAASLASAFADAKQLPVRNQSIAKHVVTQLLASEGKNGKGLSRNTVEVLTKIEKSLLDEDKIYKVRMNDYLPEFHDEEEEEEYQIELR